MSLTNKLGRTVSYSVLLAGVLAAGSALAQEVAPDAGTEQNPYTTLKGDHTVSGNQYLNGDLNINNPEATISLKGDGTLNIVGGNITASGVGEYENNGKKGTYRNSINAAGEWKANLVFGENFGTAKLTDGASIEANNVTINGGTFDLSGKGEGLTGVSAGDKNLWSAGSVLGATGNLAVDGGTINVSDGAFVYAKDIAMTSGEVNLKDGAVLRAFGNGLKDRGAINIGQEINPNADEGAVEKKAIINVTGEGNYIAAKTFNLNKNAELNLKNAVLDLVTNMSDEPTIDGTITNLAGLITVDNSTINGGITQDGTTAVNGFVTDGKLDEALAAAPKTTFTGKNEVNGTISNTYGVISVADGATLKADEITNKENGYIDVAGTIDGTITNSGTVTVAGSNAHINQLTGGELNISANASTSTLFGTEASTANEVYISAGNEFTLDNENFSAGKYVTYGKLALAQDVTGDAKIGNGGTVDLGSNTLTGDVAAWNNSTLAFNVDQTKGDNREQKGGKIEGALKIHQYEGETLTIKPTIALGVENGTYDYASRVANGEQNDFESLTLSQDNMLYDVAFADSGKNTLDIEKKDSSAVSNEVAAAGGNANDASLINAWVGGNARAFAEGSAAEDMAKHLNTLAQSNPKAAVAAAQALAPEANPVVNTQVTENARQIFNVAGSRLDGATRGMASGDSMIKKAGMWVQGLFNKSKLDKHNGFDIDSEGIAFGADGYVNENVKLGAGYAYTESDIDSVGRKTDADTNTGFVYGEYNAPSYYVNAVASYSKGDYKEKKHVAGKLARASYDVDSFALQTIYGYKMGDFSPEAGLRYINAKQDAYTDTAGQHVGSNSSDTLTAILGGRYAKDIKAGNYTLRPEVKLAATYDLMRDKNSTAVTLANGAGYLVRGENLKRFGIEAGAGLSMAVSDNVKVGLNYEGRFKKDYTDHTGILEARYNF